MCSPAGPAWRRAHKYDMLVFLYGIGFCSRYTVRIPKSLPHALHVYRSTSCVSLSRNSDRSRIARASARALSSLDRFYLVTPRALESVERPAVVAFRTPNSAKRSSREASAFQTKQVFSPLAPLARDTRCSRRERCTRGDGVSVSHPRPRRGTRGGMAREHDRLGLVEAL